MYAAVYIKLAAVIGERFGTVKLLAPIITQTEEVYALVTLGDKEHVRQRLVMALIIGNSRHGFVCQFLGGADFPLAD